MNSWKWAYQKTDNFIKNKRIKNGSLPGLFLLQVQISRLNLLPCFFCKFVCVKHWVSVYWYVDTQRRSCTKHLVGHGSPASVASRSMEWTNVDVPGVRLLDDAPDIWLVELYELLPPDWLAYNHRKKNLTQCHIM